MAKEIEGYIKLQIRGGQANPAPPVGPALGAKGVNIMDFTKQFNARTQDQMGKVLPVVITVYKDKSFEFVIKTPPAAVLLLEQSKKKKGSSEPNRDKIVSVNWDQVRAIAEEKMPDLNAFTVESGMKMVAGTARSMGLTVAGRAPWESVEEAREREEESRAAQARAEREAKAEEYFEQQAAEAAAAAGEEEPEGDEESGEEGSEQEETKQDQSDKEQS